MNTKIFIEAVQKYLSRVEFRDDRELPYWVVDALNAFEESEDNPENYVATTNVVVDTSPNALRYYASVMDGLTVSQISASDIFRAVADEKELDDAAIASYAEANQTWAHYPNVK